MGILREMVGKSGLLDKWAGFGGFAGVGAVWAGRGGGRLNDVQIIVFV